MKWVPGALVLVIVGAVMRRALGLGRLKSSGTSGSIPLSPELDDIYQAVAQEIETHTTILGISLNDAFNERDGSRLEMAWLMIQLSARQWTRLAETVSALLNIITRQMGNCPVMVPAHRIIAEHFKSRLMADNLRVYELLDRLAFRFQQRFHLRVRMLRRAEEMLTKEFRRTYRYMEKTQDHSTEVWSRYDFYFHDFDLISKETLLTFRALLACLSPEKLADLSEDLQRVRTQNANVGTNSVLVHH